MIHVTLRLYFEYSYTPIFLLSYSSYTYSYTYSSYNKQRIMSTRSKIHKLIVNSYSTVDKERARKEVIDVAIREGRVDVLDTMFFNKMCWEEDIAESGVVPGNQLTKDFVDKCVSISRDRRAQEEEFWRRDNESLNSGH
jgi:hypothetical protein